MKLRLTLLPDLLAVARLAPDEAMPAWARGPLLSVTWTADELSIICTDEAVPEGVQAERNWRVMKVEGPIPFDAIGVAAALVSPLATARISVFFLSTYDTDYLMVKDDLLADGIDALRRAGHDIS
ncbi:MAG TPA: ACT domain-containing protein [Thermoanaerobaculia bacterium]|jgi:hypothetical protein